LFYKKIYTINTAGMGYSTIFRDDRKDVYDSGLSN
jgi:hypothetical protein